MNALYALRFIAIVAIYIHHLNYPYALGGIGVLFFFMLSGFTMAYSMNNKNFEFNKKNLLLFYKQKIIKLYPMYIVTLFLSIPLMNASNVAFKLKDIISHILLIQTYIPDQGKVFYFNGLSWFIADLGFFYLLTPFFFYIIKKFELHRKRKIIFALIIILFIISCWIAYLFKDNSLDFSFGWWLTYISPYFRIMEYLIGFLLGIIFVNLNLNKLKDAIGFFTVLELFSIILLVLTYKFEFIKNSYKCATYYLPTMSILIFIYAFGKGLISKIISNPLFIHLGKISFIVYIVHQLVIQYVSYLIGAAMLYRENIDLKSKIAGIVLFILILCLSDSINKVQCYIIELINIKKLT